MTNLNVSHIAADRMTHLQEYFFVQANQKIVERKNAGQEVINLGIGNPDLDPPIAAIHCLQKKVSDPSSHLYPPYFGLPTFRQAIATWSKKTQAVLLNPATEILPLNGSKQGIFYLSLAFLNPGDQVLIPNPGYSAYAKAAQLVGATPVFYSLKEQNHFLPDLVELEKLNLPKVKMMWINYPHNPTGAMLTMAELKTIATFADKHHIILINDNPYSHITFDDYRAPSLLSLFSDPNQLFLELSSMSKTFNMPGWRIGWVAGNSLLISIVKNVSCNIETGQFPALQDAATTALVTTPQSWLKTRNQIYQKRQKLVQDLLQELGCSIVPSQATLYVWAKLPGIGGAQNSAEFVFKLLERTGVFLAPGSAFGTNGEGYIRGSICQPAELIERARILISDQS